MIYSKTNANLNLRWFWKNIKFPKPPQISICGGFGKTANFQNHRKFDVAVVLEKHQIFKTTAN